MKKIACCLLCGALCSDLFGVQISPFVYSFDPTNDAEDKSVAKQQEFTYSITNKSDETIAFEITVFRRYMDRNGNERLEKDDNSFMVFPSQLIIAPHKIRVVKLRWMGNEELKRNPHKEQAFRVQIKQFHINLNPFQKKRRGSSVEFNIQVMTSLYMTPGLSKAKPVVTNIQVLPNGLAKVSVANRGNRRIEFSALKTEVDLPGYKGPLFKVLDKDKDGSIQPGQNYEFVITPSQRAEAGNASPQKKR